MLSQKDNTLQLNQYMKSHKIQYVIYADLEYLIIKIDGCAKNSEKSSTARIGKHVPCGYSILSMWAFDNIEYKHSLYRGEDCIKNFCSYLREYATNAISFEKKKMLLLTKKELQLHQDVTACYVCGKRFPKKFAKDKNYREVRDHCNFTGKYRGAAHNICNLRFNVHNEIPVVFHSGSNYGYHFIIKELANESEGNLNVQGKIQKSTKFLPS